MNKEQLSDMILEYIKAHKGTSYAELELFFDKTGFDYRGELELYSDKNANVVFWAGWNEEAVSLIGDLIREGKIKRIPVARSLYPIVRLMDGKALSYPLLRGNPESIKHPHWLPCVFVACTSHK